MNIIFKNPGYFPHKLSTERIETSSTTTIHTEDPIPDIFHTTDLYARLHTIRKLNLSIGTFSHIFHMEKTYSISSLSTDQLLS